MSAPRLTLAQLEAWQTFGPEWGPFKNAWFGRGFRLPPMGSPNDDGERPSQRSMLWRIARERPNDLGRWVRDAPGRTTREVIAHVLRQWQFLRGSVGHDGDDDEDKRIHRLDGRSSALADLHHIGELLDTGRAAKGTCQVRVESLDRCAQTRQRVSGGDW
jgi:hypothetical protein